MMLPMLVADYLLRTSLDSLLVTTTDAHGSEYIGESDKILQTLTSFTGSFGIALIKKDGGFLFTDPRYYLQASKELAPGFVLCKKLDDFVNKLKECNRIGYDSRCTSQKLYKKISSDLKESVLIPDHEFVDVVWPERPKRVFLPVEDLENLLIAPYIDEKILEIVSVPEKFQNINVTGSFRKDKISTIRSTIKDGETVVITSLDEIAWILNLRGNDIAYNPLFYSFLIIDKNHATLYTDANIDIECFKRNYTQNPSAFREVLENVKGTSEQIGTFPTPFSKITTDRSGNIEVKITKEIFSKDKPNKSSCAVIDKMGDNDQPVAISSTSTTESNSKDKKPTFNLKNSDSIKFSQSEPHSSYIQQIGGPNKPSSKKDWVENESNGSIANAESTDSKNIENEGSLTKSAISSHYLDPKHQSDSSKSTFSVEIRPYEQFYTELPNLSGIVHLSPLASVFVRSSLSKCILKDYEHVIRAKSIKNEVEILGERIAHLYDAIALVKLFDALDHRTDADTEDVKIARKATHENSQLREEIELMNHKVINHPDYVPSKDHFSSHSLYHTDNSDSSRDGDILHIQKELELPNPQVDTKLKEINNFEASNSHNSSEPVGRNIETDYFDENEIIHQKKSNVTINGAQNVDNKEHCLNTTQKYEINRKKNFFQDFKTGSVSNSGIPKPLLTEIQIDLMLTTLKKTHAAFRGLSFGTIVGSNSNGAIIHHAASQTAVESNSLILLDSGSQYVFGTTDISRTICLGDPTDDQKKDFTTVLKAQIKAMTQVYHKDAKTSAIDTLARAEMWNTQNDYAHATGHGVGHFSNVHENPPSISANGDTIKPGNIFSIEPGLYREGKYGIRIEDLVLSIQDGDWIKLENITLAPLQMKMICKEMLDPREIVYINKSNKKIRSILTNFIEESELGYKFLIENTEPI